jgi:hypothetical protein
VLTEVNEEIDFTQCATSANEEGVEDSSTLFTGVIDEEIEKESEEEKGRNFIRKIKTLNAHKTADWPEKGSLPVSEFTEIGLFSKAFPKLFPTGRGDPSSPVYASCIKLQRFEAFEYLMKHKTARFAQHPRFRFFCFNMLIRHRSGNSSKFFVKKTKNENLDLQTMLDMGNLETNELMRKLSSYSSNIRGSAAYKNSRRSELLDLFPEIGCPNFFMTFSCADTFWEQLQKILTQLPNGSLSTNSQRVIDNPGIVDCYFDKVMDILIEKLLKPVFKVTDYWFIYEWQMRGSIHMHGLFWVGDFPYTNIEETEAAAVENKEDFLDYLEEKISAWHHFGPLAEEIFSENPTFLQKNFRPDEISEMDAHPSALSIPAEVTEEDLGRLCHKVNRHTKCSATTCLKLKRGKLVCKTGCPKTVRSRGSFIRNDKGIWLYEPRRNDPWMNPYNPFLITVLRCNMDIKVVTSVRALVEYLTKYVCKREPGSTNLADILKSFAQNKELRKASADTILTKCLNSQIKNRDYSAQEIMHYLLQVKSFSCSRSFIVGNVTGGMEFNQDGGVQTTAYQHYLNRPNHFESMSFYTYLKTTRVGKLPKSLRVEAVPRIFPKNMPFEKNEEYFEIELKKYKPHRPHTNLKGDFSTFEDSFKNIDFFLNQSLNTLQNLTQVILKNELSNYSFRLITIVMTRE